jgi:hypothetical protein
VYNFDPVLHRKSIKKLSNYTFTKVIMGHGDPVPVDAEELMKKLVTSDEIRDL